LGKGQLGRSERIMEDNVKRYLREAEKKWFRVVANGGF
jgi:hypothetical protein